MAKRVHSYDRRLDCVHKIQSRGCMSTEKPDRICFLSAQWKRLLLLTYDIDPQLLSDHLPPGLTLDTIDGRAFVSLVAFDFLDTRVVGIR